MIDIKFDFVIGNPPYQGNSLGDNITFLPSIYHCFMEESYKICDRVILITPARFLFKVGNTPKKWNEKMLSDNHFKVIEYMPNISTSFSNVDIKGGVAITYRDKYADFGSINTFIPVPELKNIIYKVTHSPNFVGLDNITISAYSYHFTEDLYKEHPELVGRQSKGHMFDLKSVVFNKLPEIFFDKKPNDNNTYAVILGRDKNGRKYKYINCKYINNVINFDCYKVFFPKATGVGTFGENIPEPIIATPDVGHTETFLSIGCFSTVSEAESLKTYMHTKFFRTLLFALKKTQNISLNSFSYIPLQDFTIYSDIDWTKSVHEIDEQLYNKYNLSQKEINFIETHIKEML